MRVPPEGPRTARIAIVGEAPGEYEVIQGRPFVGPAGECLDKLLNEAGIDRRECYITNVLKVRPEGNKLEKLVARGKKAPAPDWVRTGGLWFHPTVADSLGCLQAELAEVQPELTIPLGNLALCATTGHWGISDWRGSQLVGPSGSIVPTYHPAAILRQWSWRSYVSRDLARARDALANPRPAPQYNFLLAPTLEQLYEQFHRLRARLEQGPLLIACDIETRRRQIDCIGLAWTRTDALCIPFWSRPRPNYWSAVEELDIVQNLRSILTHPNARITGQNFSYDVQYIWRQWGFIPRLALDTMLAHHTAWPGTDKDLNTLSSLYCDHHVFWKHESKEADEREDDSGRWGYNCRDCVATWEIAQALAPLIISEGLAEQCVFQHTMWWRSLETMVKGVRTDVAAKKGLSGELKQGLKERQEWVEAILGHPLNLRSPKQLKALFYDDFRLPVIKVRSKQEMRISTNEEALQQIALRTPLVRPLVRRILEIRSLGVFKSTFVDAKLDVDGRIRCSYNVGGTKTFRLSSSQNAFGSGMNLQNVPEGGETEGLELILPNVRKLFLPDPGMEIFDLDLSSADLRVVVWESGEAELRQLLDAGLNPYVEMAKEYYNDPEFTKQHHRYRTFKSLAHGTNYLGSAAGLAKRLGLGIAETRRVQSWYLTRFPRIRDWQDRLKQQLRERRAVTNAFGYRWYCFDRMEDEAYRQAAAWIPQSSIGLLINRIWDRVVTECPEVNILLQVHDSLVGQWPIERREYFSGRVREIAAGCSIPYPEPLIIPVGLKTSLVSWGDCGS